MNAYFYIPTAIEPLLHAYQQNWLAQSPKAYTVVTGHYSQQPTEQDQETTYTTILDQLRQPIPAVFTSTDEFLFDQETPQLYLNTIQGFILEVNPHTLPPAIYELLNNTPGIQGYPNSQALLAALNQS